MRAFTGKWKYWKVTSLSGVFAGVALGLFFRLFPVSPVAERISPKFTLIMTVAFLAFVPLAMGYLSVREYMRATPAESVRWYALIPLPMASILLAMLMAVLVGWEGRICIIFAAPIMLLFSLLGGFCAWIAWLEMGDRSPGKFSAIAFPLVLLLIESHIPNPYEVRTVRTEVLIHAPANLVWNNIKSVRAIEPAELPESWVGKAGFPRPIAATLSHEGIGGVRQASFTGGLLFTETVNVWKPEANLAFTIHADTASIPKTTLDEHVVIGGIFFDVLDGEYRLEQRPDGILLHLSSRERLSTHFNAYAGQWTDAVMRAIQEQILAVIQRRCEVESAAS